MKCFTASPDLGAILAYVFGGIAIARSVGTTALPLAGTAQSAALQRGTIVRRVANHSCVQ